jgi:WD40 repeat protein
LWDTETEKEIFVLRGHSDGVESVAFSPDGKTLASGAGDYTVRLWNADTGKKIYIFRGHSRYIDSVAFSPDGTTLALGSSDNTVRLWSVATGKEIAVLKGHSSDVRSVAFSPDGETLASGSGKVPSIRGDNTIRLWNLTLLNDYIRNGRESRLFQKIHDLSFEILPYQLEGIKMVNRIHRRIPLRGQPQPWKVFERPRPSHVDPVTWMIQNLDRMEPTKETSD